MLMSPPDLGRVAQMQGLIIQRATPSMSCLLSQKNHLLHFLGPGLYYQDGYQSPSKAKARLMNWLMVICQFAQGELGSMSKLIHSLYPLMPQPTVHLDSHTARGLSGLVGNLDILASSLAPQKGLSVDEIKLLVTPAHCPKHETQSKDIRSISPVSSPQCSFPFGQVIPRHPCH